MLLRRSLVLTIGAILPLALTGCVQDFATDRVNTVAAGASDRDATVDVLNAVIVSSEPGSGTFISSFSNNNVDEPVSFEVLEGIDQAQLTAEEFAPVEIPAAGLVNLAAEGGVPVTGDFEAGNFVPVSVQFSNGEQVQIDIPVYTNCGIWEGLDEGTAECETHDSEESH